MEHEGSMWRGLSGHAEKGGATTQGTVCKAVELKGEVPKGSEVFPKA